MSSMFWMATSFNQDISKWEVSRVRNMHQMFMDAMAFKGDISPWVVSRVQDMSYMFANANVFNADVSKWDVSSVTNMDYMFARTQSFNRKLCGAAWIFSRASKKRMFEGSAGSISGTRCRGLSPPRWLAKWEVASQPNTSSLITPHVVSAINSCPNCGMFEKSGRVSCCAPGGAWYKNCGGASDINVGHSWIEGVEACKRKCKVGGRGFMFP